MRIDIIYFQIKKKRSLKDDLKFMFISMPKEITGKFSISLFLEGRVYALK